MAPARSPDPLFRMKRCSEGEAGPSIMYGIVSNFDIGWDQDIILLHWHRYTCHLCRVCSKHLTVVLDFGSNQLHWLLLRDGNRYLSLKQGHPFFPVSVWKLGKWWDQEMTTLQWYRETFHWCYLRSKQLAIGLHFGSSHILGPLVWDGKDVLKLKQCHPLCMAVFGDLKWGGIRMKHHFNNTNTPATHAMCAQTIWLYDYILAQKQDLWTPPSGWGWCSEVEVEQSSVSFGVWGLHMRWGEIMTTLQWYPHTWYPHYVRSNHLAVWLDFGYCRILEHLLQDDNHVPMLEQGHPLSMSI